MRQGVPLSPAGLVHAAHAGVCTRCAAGCSTWIDENQDHVYRVRPRENRLVNDWWICDDGRRDYAHLHDQRRLVRPLRRDGATLAELGWTDLPRELDRRLRDARPLAAILSPFLSVEEAYLLAKYIRTLDPQARLGLGPVPAAGEDQHFPGGFTIAAEKCPNRRGVEEVLAHFAGPRTTLEELPEQVEQGAVRGLWITGGDRDLDAQRRGASPAANPQSPIPNPLLFAAAARSPGPNCSSSKTSSPRRSRSGRPMSCRRRPSPSATAPM